MTKLRGSEDTEDKIGPGLRPKRYPAGTYCLLGSNRFPNPIVLDNPDIKGYRIRTGWANVQPALGMINFDYIKLVVSQAAAKKQKCGIGVSAGVSCPPEIFTEGGVYKFTLAPDDRSIENWPPDMALPWDEAFHELWYPVIDALALAFDKDPNVSYIVVSGFMQLFENRFVGTQSDLDKVNALAQTAGYADFAEGYTAGAQDILDYYISKFKNTILVLTKARVIPFNNQLGNDLFDWAKDESPTRFGTMTAALKAKPPPHLPNTNDPLDYPKGDQPIFSTLDRERLYVPGTTPDPWPADPQPCDDLLAHAASNDENDMWVELYEVDAKNTVNAPVIKARGLELIANADKAQK